MITITVPTILASGFNADGFTGEQNIYGFGPPQFQAWVAHCEATGQKLW